VNKIVKLEKLAKTLRRDLTANPLKASVLGILLLGALYFWGPLIWKHVAGPKATDSTAAAAISPSEQVATQNSSAQPVAETPMEAWREIRNRRMNDPSAHSATYRPEWGQIFQSAATVAPPTKPQLEAVGARQLDDDPEKLGLVLQGIAIGAGSKKAIINGKVYRELDIVTVKKTAERPELKFLVVQVTRRMAEVEHGGRRWKLLLRTKSPNSKETEDTEPVSETKDKAQDEPDSAPKQTGTPSR
jgi:hypothetical protein